MASSHSMDLTKGSVFKQLIIFAIPVLLSNLLQQLYNAADVIVVGRFAANGETALAAVGSTGAITLLLLNLFNGLAIGANIVCSNLFGARKRAALSDAMHTSVLLAVVSGVSISIIGVIFARPLLQLMSCREEIIDQATLYMQIFFCGAPFSLLYNFGAGILRAFGDTRRPMYILATTGLVNVGLNLFFVVVLHLDVAGVALATIVAQFLSAVMVLLLLFSPRGEYKMQLRKLRFHKQAISKVIAMGIPCGMNGMVFNIANVTIQSSINTFSPAVVAGNTVGSNVTDFIYLIMSAFYTANVSFAGQCYGAKQYKRIDRLLVTSIIISCVGSLAATGIATIFSEELFSLYNTEPAVIQAATSKLLILGWTYYLCGISEMAIGCMRGMGRSTMPTLLNAFCICAPRLLWVWFIFPLNPVPKLLYICFPVSWGISAVVQVVYYLHCRKKLFFTEVHHAEIAK